MSHQTNHLLRLAFFLAVSLAGASTIRPRTASELETTDSETMNAHKDFLSLLRGPLIPAAFMNPHGARNNPRCTKSSTYVDMDDKVFVEELPSPRIESNIREIINTFVEALKHDKSWFVSLLFQIRKEQKRRESESCSEAECIYKIPCYLSQSFRSVPMYSEMLKRARVREGFDLLSRRRRSLDGLEMDAEFKSLVSSGKAPVTNCTGIFANYCYNSISCIYVSVLESAACSCMPGYTGLRCDLYDLSITLATLSQFRTTTVDIEVLRPEDSATMYSVLDATARYTYSAFEIEDEV
ncbi:EGF region [Echinococcus multilocularis]|uniref:EGF region n=1 Tax=Echinococcus multilocularis TaxID=6211 RepID=A0A068Y670_ECHMU|nr:EGF region [Echinococcus multilocularis]